MADKRSDTKQILQDVLDVTFSAIKIVNADPSSGGATEVTAQEILTAVESINAKTPAAPATAGNQTSTNTKLDTLISQTDGVEASLSSIDTKTPALVSGRQPVDGSGVTQPISAVSLPLPTGSATETSLLNVVAAVDGLETLTNEIATDTQVIATLTDAINTKTPALGQALAAASTPVVLTAAQIVTLTPQTDALTDTQLRATAVPVSVSSSTLPSGAATETTLAGIRTRQDVVDYGSATTAQRVSAMLGIGTTAVSSINPVPTSGVGGASVQLTSSTVHPYYQDFSIFSLSTTYTQVIAATNSINAFSAVNNSATPIYISTGAVASEIVRYIIMPGEVTGRQVMQIAAGTRIAIRTVAGSETAGKFSLNVFSV